MFCPIIQQDDLLRVLQMKVFRWTCSSSPVFMDLTLLTIKSRFLRSWGSSSWRIFLMNVRNSHRTCRIIRLCWPGSTRTPLLMPPRQLSCAGAPLPRDGSSSHGHQRTTTTQRGRSLTEKHSREKESEAEQSCRTPVLLNQRASWETQ